MLARCVTLTAFLAVTTSPRIAGRPDVPVLDADPQTEVIIRCADGLLPPGGEAMSWHTPFGPLTSTGIETQLAPVHMEYDGNLVLHNVSDLHLGLYYCLLRRHGGGSTMFPYHLRMRTEHGERDGPRELDKQEAISNQLFTGAVTAAVLLTFVFGFGAGALSSPKILRCLRAITERLSSARRSQPDITMKTLTDWPSSSSLCPPAKPQRSFREKLSVNQEEENNMSTAYLEACDHVDKGTRSKNEEEVQEVEDGKIQEDERGEADDRKNRNDDKGAISPSSRSGDEDKNQVAESPSSSRPRRIIRVYQYDQDGRLYDHITEPGPASAHNQRAASIIHLNAIMAAASVGPMDAAPQKDSL